MTFFSVVLWPYGYKLRINEKYQMLVVVPSIATFHGAIYLKVIVVMLPPLPALLVTLVSLVAHVDQDGLLLEHFTGRWTALLQLFLQLGCVAVVVVRATGSCFISFLSWRGGRRRPGRG